MHDIHSLINFEKSILKGHFQPIKLIKMYSEKMLIFFSVRYLETMVTYNNQIRFLKFVILYSCTIELILEELKDIKWHLTSDIKKSGPHTCFSGIIFTIKGLIQTKFTQQQVNIQHFVTGILYLCKTEVNSLISMSEKKVPLLLHRGVPSRLVNVLSYREISGSYLNEPKFESAHDFPLPNLIVLSL